MERCHLSRVTRLVWILSSESLWITWRRGIKWSPAFRVLTVVGAKQDNNVTVLSPGKGMRRKGLLLSPGEAILLPSPKHLVRLVPAVSRGRLPVPSSKAPFGGVRGRPRRGAVQGSSQPLPPSWPPMVERGIPVTELCYGRRGSDRHH